MRRRSFHLLAALTRQHLFGATAMRLTLRSTLREKAGSLPGMPNNQFVERGQTLQLRHKTGNDAETACETTLFVGYRLGLEDREAATFTSAVEQSYYPGTLTADTGSEIATENCIHVVEARGMEINHTELTGRLLLMQPSTRLSMSRLTTQPT